MAYRITEARQARDLAQRQHILDCALQQVVDGGFSSLSMGGLARNAEIATGTLYRHFAGKGELAAEVFARATQIEVNTLRSQFQSPGRADARLRLGLAQFSARAWHSRQLAYALIAEPVDPEVDAQRLNFREIYAELYCELIRQGNAEGSFRVDNIPITAACLVGAVAEALVGPLSPQARADRDSGLPSESLESVTRAITLFSLRALGAEESSP